MKNKHLTINYKYRYRYYGKKRRIHRSGMNVGALIGIMIGIVIGVNLIPVQSN